MTSKISSIKLIVGEIKRKAYLEVLIAMILFCLMPGYGMIRLEGVLQDKSSIQLEGTEWIRNFFPGIINGGTETVLFITIGVLAILLAAAEFGYLHSREKIDFYHALPIRRKKIFMIRYTSGLFMFLLPYVICTVLTILVGTIQGIMDGAVLLQSLKAMAGGILGFLLIYHVGITGMLLCGQTITGIIASGVLLIYFDMVFSLVASLESVYFASYSSRSDLTILGTAGHYLSPGKIYYVLINLTSGQMNGAVIPLLAAVLGMILVLWVIGMLLHRRYPSETAGKALSYPNFASLIKVLICVPAGLTVGLILNEYVGMYGSGNYGKKWVALISIGAALILCMMTEFIYNRDLKKIFICWKSTLLSVGAVGVILLIFSCDLFDYDTYLPAEDKIVSVSFYPYTLQSYFEYPDYEQEREMTVSGKEKELLLNLAKQGMKNLLDGRTQHTMEEENNSEYVTVDFGYKLQSGRSVRRCYVLGRQETLEVLEQLCERKEFREELFPIFSLNENRICLLSVTDIDGKKTALNLSEQERERLLAAYKKDVLSEEIQQLDRCSAIGEMSVTYSEEQTNTHVSWNEITVQGGVEQTGGFYIYEDYTNTLSCLKALGYELKSSIDPNEVNSITFYDYEEEGTEAQKWLDDFLNQLKNRNMATDNGSGVRAVVTDPEDIEFVLKHILYSEAGILGDIGKGYGIYVNLATADGTNDWAYYLNGDVY